MLYFAFMPSKLQGRLPYILLVAVILVLDRWTKALVQARFGLNDSVTVIDGFFDITYVRNTGVAFGIFDLVSLPAKSILLSAFTALAQSWSPFTASEAQLVTAFCKWRWP